MSSIGYAVAPAWGVMLISGVLAGLGAGAIDAGIKRFRGRPVPAAVRELAARLVSALAPCWGRSS